MKDADAQRDRKAMEVFGRALELPGAETRAAYLASACGGDGLLKARVEALLISHQEDEFLQKPAAARAPGVIAAVAQVAEKPGTVIGRYKLLEQIGEGGFGVVFMAEQQEPVRRKVALKIIKPGMDTRQVIARFEAERQALALMDHPHIAKVLDGGTTGAPDSQLSTLNSQLVSGRPYFVMELVQGVPITRFCEDHQLSVKERIELFLPVCQAIQHAHHKGVIHRDIKPSNVLVTLNEGVPHAMVIDFGVAKAIDQRLTEKTLFTNFARMIGTPAYMSPEQAEMSKQDVDTRSDVYSLGILLYELLTGTTPFPEERLKQVGYAELQRIITEEEPLRPSTVLSRLNGQFRKVAANRRCEPAALLKLIKGDLDWIVLKAIEKDRNRRYETPNGLAMDLQRYLADEPVTARPPSTAYQLQKFIRRNRVGVTAGVSVAVALAAGTLIATWQAIEAKREKANAEQQAATAQAALGFIQEDLFRGARFQPNVTLADAMEAAVSRIGDRYRDEPLVEAAIQLTMGKGYRALSNAPKAEEHLSQAIELYSNLLGPDHEKTLEARLELAWVLSTVSRYQEAEALVSEVLALREARLGPSHEETLKALVCAGHIYVYSARLEEAERNLRRALDAALVANNVEIVHDALTDLAWVESSRGNYDKVVELWHEAFTIARDRFGPDDPQTLSDACFRLEHLRTHWRHYHEAQRLANDAYQRAVRALGEDHRTTRHLLIQVLELDRVKGFQVTSEFQQLLESIQREVKTDQRYLLFPQFRLGLLLINNGYLDEGIATLADVWDRNVQLEGTGTWLSRQTANFMARGYTLQGRFGEAEELRKQLLELGRHELGPGAPWVVKEQHWSLANLLARQAKWAEATDALASIATGPAQLESAVPPGLLAAWLADDRESLDKLGHQALKHLSSTQNASEAFDLAQALLLTLDRIPGISIPQALQPMERALNLQTDPVKQTVLSTLVAWRKKDSITAIGYAGGLGAEADGSLASLGRFILAMATFDQGDSNQARLFLQTAQDRLDQALRSGDLGERWVKIAPALIASDAASAVIPGQPPAPLVNPANLAHARQAWQPVRDLLTQGDWAARRQDWDQALDAYRQAAAHPQFSWDAALLQDPSLRYKFASLLVFTGQTNEYVAFCREAIRPDKALYLLPGFPDGEIAQLGLLNAQRSLEVIPTDQESVENRHWKELTLGMAEYRNGNYAEALQLLENARAAFNLNCSGTAAAFGAMASERSGLGEQAKTLLTQSEEAHRQLLERNADDLGPSWHDTVILQIALQEARSTLAQQ